MTLRCAILLSGTGRTLANLLAERDAGRLPIEISGVLSSKAGVRGLEIATAAHLQTAVVDRRECASEERFADAVTATLYRWRPDLLAMAGLIHFYRLPPRFLGRAVNIHPALLPKFGGRGFYGERVHRAVLAAGEKESGCTVHFVDNEYDHGEIILQRRCPVLPGDTPHTLADRVFTEECLAYPEAL
ncbi:MAG: phosphoribosylglycinamide formyltransferase, partial [Planctomycetes bacterium]|nr:phosphoribosylglycinamide formyltransferase [Planctomycetota bacterium]